MNGFAGFWTLVGPPHPCGCLPPLGRLVLRAPLDNGEKVEEDDEGGGKSSGGANFASLFLVAALSLLLVPSCLSSVLPSLVPFFVMSTCSHTEGSRVRSLRRDWPDGRRNPERLLISLSLDATREVPRWSDSKKKIHSVAPM